VIWCCSLSDIKIYRKTTLKNSTENSNWRHWWEAAELPFLFLLYGKSLIQILAFPRMEMLSKTVHLHLEHLCFYAVMNKQQELVFHPSVWQSQKMDWTYLWGESKSQVRFWGKITSIIRKKRQTKNMNTPLFCVLSAILGFPRSL